MVPELHIASLVVHSTPKRLQRVSHLIGTIPGALIHGTSAAGKLVVTLEAATSDEIAAKVGAIQDADGVLSAALVYHCADTLAAMNEVMPDADDPT
jgi:nitrate reductase NapD